MNESKPSPAVKNRVLKSKHTLISSMSASSLHTVNLPETEKSTERTTNLSENVHLKESLVASAKLVETLMRRILQLETAEVCQFFCYQLLLY